MIIIVFLSLLTDALEEDVKKKEKLLQHLAKVMRRGNFGKSSSL